MSVLVEIELHRMTDCQGHLSKQRIYFIQKSFNDFLMFLFNFYQGDKFSRKTHGKIYKRLIKAK